MFGKNGMFPFTPAESARCGLLLQGQKWYLDKAEGMGLQDGFEFTLELADDLRDEEAERSWHRATWWIQIPLKFLQT
jgi:hypothetical protein